MRKLSLMLFLFLTMTATVPAVEKMTALQLIELARRDPARLREALVETLGAENIKKGTVALGRGEDFIWALQAANRPTLLVDEAPGPAMIQIEGTDIWYAIGKLGVGTAHGFSYVIDGKAFGGNRNVPAYGPDSYLSPVSRKDRCRRNWSTQARSMMGCEVTIGSTSPRNTIRKHRLR